MERRPGPDDQWDFFIAHAGDDAPAAEELYDELAAGAQVFLDSRCLLPGDDWDQELRSAQAASRITVVLVSGRTDQAYYQREEVAAALDMARRFPTARRVVPVYLDPADSARESVPYGLRLKHGLSVLELGGLGPVAKKLLATLIRLHGGQLAPSRRYTDEREGFAPRIEPTSTEVAVRAAHVPSRDNFKSVARRRLAERVGYRCSYPHCAVVTVGPMEQVGDGSASIGVAAHIAAAAPGGPRYDPTMTSEGRSSIDNGIWLCQNHARLIDADPLSHPTELLRAWKLSAESRARDSLIGSRTHDGNELPEPTSRLPWHLLVAMASLHVDLMRLFVVRFGDTTHVANHERLSEFLETADDQIEVFDHHVSGLGHTISSELRTDAISIRANLGKTLLALKRSAVNPGTTKTLVANLRDVAARIESLLVSAEPKLLEPLVVAVDDSVRRTPRVPMGGGNWVDQLARRRFRAQNHYLRGASNLGSISDDFGQALAVPYFLIDARFLREY